MLGRREVAVLKNPRGREGAVLKNPRGREGAVLKNPSSRGPDAGEEGGCCVEESQLLRARCWGRGRLLC